MSIGRLSDGIGSTGQVFPMNVTRGPRAIEVIPIKDRRVTVGPMVLLTGAGDLTGSRPLREGSDVDRAITSVTARRITEKIRPSPN